ncbi:TonB-dependent receptor [Sphingobium cloacae]|uniref:TonB-dependent receptor n=1 Tax=Sphingobium cloacae TaxID=120107 RepID=UPI000A4665C7|nr:TonB-dependent receptor [Sphingobium cloacae]
MISARMFKCQLLLGVCVIAPVATASAQVADQGLADIVVTATKREGRLQNVPVTVSAFTGDALAKANITDAKDLGMVTPGLTITSGNGVVTPFARGIGNDVAVFGNEASTAVYVDGVYYARLPEAAFQLSDVERIEVLKGPQGTLFGRNASGGLINIITLDPGNELGGKITAGYGNYDAKKLQGFIGGPIAPGVRASLSGYFIDHDGWGKYVTTGDDTNYLNEKFVRGKIVADVSERTEIKISGEYLYFRSDIGQASNAYRGTTQGYQVTASGASPKYISGPLAGMPTGLADPDGPVITPARFYDSNNSFPTLRINKSYAFSFRLKQDLGFAEFLAISAYRKESEGAVIIDPDNTPLRGTDVDLHPRAKTFTQELQLTSRSGSPIEWIIGAYYLYTKTGYYPSAFNGLTINAQVADSFGLANPVPGARFQMFGSQTVNSYAAFGQATYKVADHTNITLGGRYTIDKLVAVGRTEIYSGYQSPAYTLLASIPALDANGDNPHARFSKFTYKASLDHHFSNDVMAFASISRGYKAGVFNTQPVSITPAKPEIVDAYEIGLKTEFFDRKVRLNLAAFWNDVKNPQTYRFDNTAVIFGNAQKARTKGVELEATVRAARGLTLTGGATYLDARYRKFTNAVFVLPAGTVVVDPIGNPAGVFVPGNGLGVTGDASGNRMSRSPKFTGNIGFNYDLELGGGTVGLSGNYAYNSGYYWFPDNRLRQRRYGVLNSAVSFTPAGERIVVAVWGKNLANKKYYSLAAENNGASGDASAPAPPRT